LLSQPVQLTQPQALILNVNGTSNTFCEGDSTGVLNTSAVGGTPPYTYTLDGANSQSTGVYTQLHSGNYAVVVTDAHNCSASENVQVDHDNDFPVAAFAYNAAGNSVAFDNQSNFNLSNSWDFGDGSTSTLLAPVHVYSQPGTYSVTLIVQNACGSDTLTMNVSTGTIGIAEYNGPLVAIYPNPNNGEFMLKISALQQKGDLTLNIMDLGGKVLHSENILVSSQNYEEKFGTKELSSGVYVLEIIGEIWSQKQLMVISQNALQK